MNRIDALQSVSHNTHSAHVNELEEDVDFLAEILEIRIVNTYNFVIDRFLLNEPGNILEDEEQPILFMNYSVRGRRLPTFCIIKIASERAKYEGCHI